MKDLLKESLKNPESFLSNYVKYRLCKPMFFVRPESYFTIQALKATVREVEESNKSIEKYEIFLGFMAIDLALEFEETPALIYEQLCKSFKKPYAPGSYLAVAAYRNSAVVKDMENSFGVGVASTLEYVEGLMNASSIPV